MNDAGLHELVRDFMSRNQAMIEAASPGIVSYAHPSSQESARSPLNPSTLFPLTPNNVAVAVDESTADVQSMPHQLPTRNEEVSSTKNLERCRKRKAHVLQSTPTDPLEKSAFDVNKSGTLRKNSSGKSGQMAN
jgi:hypothetical protein